MHFEIETSPTRVVAYTYHKWAFGSVHYELAKYLHPDIDLSVLPWTDAYSHAEMAELASGTDLFMTQPDAVQVLVEHFGISPEQILVVGHCIYDFRRMQEQGHDLKDLSIYGGLAVISENLKHQLRVLDSSLNPKVLPLGINYEKYRQEPSRNLSVLGYAGRFVRDDDGDGLDCKRGYLAQRVADLTGLELRVAERYHNSYVTMPGFYSGVDCVLVTSTEKEAGGLPVFEAAAAGRLVMSTPVGHLKESGICADVLPLDETSFVDVAVELINNYIQNADLFAKRTKELQTNAKKYDWSEVIDKWAAFIKGE